MSSICVIGTGYVGLVTGTCFADLGNDVVCLDIIPEKIENLKRGVLPIYEPGLEEMVKRNADAGRLRFTTNYAEAVPGAEFAFIAVGTPQGEDGSADMRYVETAARQVAQHIDGNIVIVNKSTVPIGSGERVADIVRLNLANPNASFAVVSNPEFLREGSALADFMNPDRVVLGGSDEAAAQRVGDLYGPLNPSVIITDLRTAEMIKYASNALLATRISFMNEMAQICEALNADVKTVAEGMGYDKRIGPHFLQAGIGYGGSCFPKDVTALSHMAVQHNTHPQLLLAVMDINHDARRAFVQKVERVMGSVTGRTLAVWGLAFKPNTDDMREAAAIEIITALCRKGAHIRAYDPAAVEQAQRILPAGVVYCDDAYATAEDADAVLLLTEWNEFKQIDLARVKNSLTHPYFFDGRNLYDPAAMHDLGYTYWGVGRRRTV